MVAIWSMDTRLFAMTAITAQEEKGKTMRLIDADHFLKTLWEIVREAEDETWSKIADTMRFMIESEVAFDEVDAVPVVRCKDCKHYSNHDKRCTVWNHGIDSNGYCHKGERKEDDNH